VGGSLCIFFAPFCPKRRPVIISATLTIPSFIVAGDFLSLIGLGIRQPDVRLEHVVVGDECINFELLPPSLTPALLMALTVYGVLIFGRWPEEYVGSAWGRAIGSLKIYSSLCH
jgi:ABC-type dipeptide/oligopeptide/nickel transport system permease subunit